MHYEGGAMDDEEEGHKRRKPKVQKQFDHHSNQRRALNVLGHAHTEEPPPRQLAIAWPLSNEKSKSTAKD